MKRILFFVLCLGCEITYAQQGVNLKGNYLNLVPQLSLPPYTKGGTIYYDSVTSKHYFKQGATWQTITGSIASANNALTSVGSNIQLGGSLIQHTNIDGHYNLLFGNSVHLQTFKTVSDEIVLGAEDPTGLGGFSLYGYDASSHGGKFDIAAGNSRTIFTDTNPSPKGIEYNANGYVTQNQSLADKQYTDEHLKGYTFSNSPSTNYVPQFNGTNITWVPVTGTLASNSDVNISSPANLDLLQYQTSDSKWHNTAAPIWNQNTTGSSAKWTTARNIAITGDLAWNVNADGSGNVTAAGTLATVNSNVGTFGSATQSLTATVNGKGLITAISAQTVTPAVGSITGLGTGVGTWLATPSWANFNSAITGTAPYWALTGTSTATGAMTISSTIANNLTFSASGTTTANNQASKVITSTHTLRGTASDNFTDTQLYPTVTLGSTLQNPIGLDLSMTYVQTGGVGITTISTSTVAGMTATTYTNVAPASTSGPGTGALFNVVVGSATSITSITQTTPGSGYKVNETITFNGNQFGPGSGSAIYTIKTVTGVSLGTSATPLKISVNGENYSNTPKFIDFWEQGVQIGSIGTYVNQTLSFNDNTSTNFNLTSTGASFIKNVTVQGTFNATSTSSLTGATTSLTTIGGAILNTFAYTSTGSAGGINQANAFASRYKTAGTIGVVGQVSAVSITTGGSGYTTGVKTTTGGTGTGCSLNITSVSAGVITGIGSLSGSSTQGSNYVIGDVLTLSGGTSGTVTVTGVDWNGSVSSFEDANSYTDAKSNNNYITLLGRPTYNITSTQTGSTWFAYYNPTYTNLGSFIKGGINIVPTGTVNGIGAGATPLSTWDVNGSLSGAITISTGNLTLDATHHTIVITSGTGTYTLPAASGATRRMYCIINQTGGARTISSYIDKSGASQTTISANSSLWLQPDGSNWYQLN